MSKRSAPSRGDGTSRRVIRLDVDWEESEWLNALNGTAAGCWPRLLCWVKKNGVRGRCKRPKPTVLARAWRVTSRAVNALEQAAIRDGALVVDDDDWVVANWAEHQKTDPGAADRMRRMRSQRKAGGDVTPVTPVTGGYGVTTVTGSADSPGARAVVTEELVVPSATESSPKKNPPTGGKKKGVLPNGKAPLPSTWRPNQNHRELADQRSVNMAVEAEKMRDWAAANGVRKLDWDATFRNWIRNAAERNGGHRIPASHGGRGGATRYTRNEDLPWMREKRR